MWKSLAAVLVGLGAVFGSMFAANDVLAGSVARATFRKIELGVCYVTDDGFVVARAHGPADRMVVNFRKHGQWHRLAVKLNVSAGTRLRVNQEGVAALGGDGSTPLRVFLRDNGQFGKVDRCLDIWAG
jgi:hypothetical protein